MTEVKGFFFLNLKPAINVVSIAAFSKNRLTKHIRKEIMSTLQNAPAQTHTWSCTRPNSTLHRAVGHAALTLKENCLWQLNKNQTWKQTHDVKLHTLLAMSVFCNENWPPHWHQYPYSSHYLLLPTTQPASNTLCVSIYTELRTIITAGMWMMKWGVYARCSPQVIVIMWLIIYVIA